MTAVHETTDMTCQELVELVTGYLDDALAPLDRVRFDAHIAGCDGCTAYLEQMRLTIATLGRLRADDLTPDAAGDLLTLFRDWRG